MKRPLIFQQISGQYADAEEMVKARDGACPMGRMGTAWDIAKAPLFLAPDEAPTSPASALRSTVA